MPHNEVYAALVELRPLKGCQIDLGDCSGAFVRLYTAAGSAEHADEKLRNWADENAFQMVDVEWCVNVSEVEWENPNDQTAEELILQARNSEEVVFEEFHTWGPDASDT